MVNIGYKGKNELALGTVTYFIAVTHNVLEKPNIKTQLIINSDKLLLITLISGTSKYSVQIVSKNIAVTILRINIMKFGENVLTDNFVHWFQKGTIIKARIIKKSHLLIFNSHG